MVVQIARQIVDDTTRQYFSREELTARAEFAVRGGKRTRSNILAAALQIPGVSSGTVMPYALVISRAPSYGWEEIEPSLLRLLTAFNLGEGRLLEVPDPL